MIDWFKAGQPVALSLSLSLCLPFYPIDLSISVFLSHLVRKDKCWYEYDVYSII